jgi:hypothetical protein
MKKLNLLFTALFITSTISANPEAAKPKPSALRRNFQSVATNVVTFGLVCSYGQEMLEAAKVIGSVALATKAIAVGKKQLRSKL